MPREEELNKNINIDLENMKISLLARVTRTSVTLEELIQVGLSQGLSKEAIKAYLLKDLEEGGRIFGEFRNAIKATANGTINNFRDSAQWSEDLDVDKYMWVAVFVNTCPDCLERHGQVKTMEEWEQEGLPRAGFTVCKQYCQCDLMDAYTTVLKPIQRNKR